MTKFRLALVSTVVAAGVTVPLGQPAVAAPGFTAWQQFDLIDRGGGNIALRARANTQFVTAENAGADPLIANRTAIGTWEQFDLINN